MDDLRLIADLHGVFLRGEALAHGYDDKTLFRGMHDGILRRVRHGCYCFTDQWQPLDSRDRHLILARAVLRTTPGPVALSHTTALLAHGVDVWGADLRRVHVTRLGGGRGRIERDVVHHEGRCADEDVVLVDDLPVLEPARALIEAGTILTVESALVSADSVLHQELCTPDALFRRFEVIHQWKGSQRLHVVLKHMDGRAANAGESRSRHMIWRHGLPRPILQYEVHDEWGHLVAILDFAWPAHRAFGEFDGRKKYLEHLHPGEEPSDAVFREKRRENRVRELTQWRGVRWDWSDLQQPHATCGRIWGVLRGVS
jgi:hypothetical protein